MYKKISLVLVVVWVGSTNDWGGSTNDSTAFQTTEIYNVSNVKVYA